MSLGVEGCPGIVHTAFEMCHVVDFPPSAMMTDRDAVDGKVAAYLRTGWLLNINYVSCLPSLCTHRTLA